MTHSENSGQLVCNNLWMMMQTCMPITQAVDIPAIITRLHHRA